MSGHSLSGHSLSGHSLSGHELSVQSKWMLEHSPRKQPRPVLDKDLLIGNDDFLYPLTGEDNEIEQYYDGILKPLQLFAPYTHEDETELQQKETVVLERPVTPINDEIKTAPQQYQKLTRYIRRRLTPKPDIKHLPVSDQKELAAVIMGEVTDVWTDIRQQVDHPFFSAEENAELQRRIAVHVVTVCEYLFNHYIDQAQVLQKRGVFSRPANMSRLKAQLALDTNKYLNILTIRRYIVDDLQKPPSDGEEDEFIPMEAQQPKKSTKLSNKHFLEASRPKSKTKKRYFVPMKQALEQLTARMPGLDTNKLMNIINDMTIEPHTPEPILSDVSSQKTRSKSTKTTSSPCKTLTENVSDGFSPNYQRPSSAPRLHPAEDLLEELGIGQQSMARIRDPPLPATMDHVHHNIEERTQPDSSTARPSEDRSQRNAEDLRRLVGGPRVPVPGGGQGDVEDDDDMPPLLQAVTRSPKHDDARRRIDQQLAELEARESKRNKEDCVNISDPRYPQPATVNTRLPNKLGLAKTSDIRVSERICMWDMTLEKNSTVYNDLLDEIDAATVKQLDSNLFLGDEITEVYKEIMKTVPTDHLDLENDPLVESAAEGSLSLSSALASATLSRPRRSDRVFNPRLARQEGACPWGEQPVEAWSRTPAQPPLDIRGRPLVQPMTPRGEDRALKDFLGKEAHKYVDDSQNMSRLRNMGEVMARTYSSWLMWWKNTINSDDYIKYLSTQETDYMGVIFHFYNEGEDDDDDEASASKISKRTQKLTEERTRMMEQLMDIKSEYRKGFWNPNTVLMGGLGAEPQLEVRRVHSCIELGQNIPRLLRLSLTSFSTTNATPTVKFKEDVTSASVADKSEATVGTQSKRKVTRKVKTDSISGDTLTKAPSAMAASQASKDKQLGNAQQDRLEQVWSLLRMPDKMRLDMAVKYSTDNRIRQLDDALKAWEKAVALILKRENQLAALEKFERLASDPNRFFEKGSRGSSVSRLHEARHRAAILKRMEEIEKDLSKLLKQIKRDYDDDITFQGREYESKMASDRTEMLYWLQEERKQQALEYEMSRRREVMSRSPHTTTAMSITMPVL